MPSSFTPNLGIEKPAEGEQDGVWGDIVNENMDILDRAINGSVTLTLTGTSSTLTTTDGALSNGQYKTIILGGTPSGTHTITIAPNDAQKIYFVYNTTAQSVVFTQGSGGNVTIATGDSAVIYSSGGGATAAVTNLTDHFAMSSVRITGGVITGITDLAVADGGTGASDAATARTNLGLGTMATQGAGAVAITGGTINGTVIGGTTAAAGTFTTGNFGLGAVGTPSITFTGDTNTGIFSPGADTLAFVEGGVEAMRISSAGFVGIGTSTPGSLLDVNGAIGAAQLIFPGGNSHLQVRAGNVVSFLDIDFPQVTTEVGTVRLYRNTNTTGVKSMRFHRGDGTATEDVRIAVGTADSFFGLGGGDLGVGTGTPAVKLDVLSDGLIIRAQSTTSTEAYMRFDGTGTSFPFIGLVGGIGTFGNTDASPIRFNTNTLERLRIDSSGNVGIGLTNPAVNLDIGGTASPQVRTLSTTNAVDLRMQALGAAGTGTFGTISNHPAVILSNNLERMRFFTSGGVSINSLTDPGANNLSVTGNILIPAATTETRAIEIGSGRAGNGTSFVDLIGDATYTDYGARLARGATGANTDTTLYHRGTGALQLLAQEAGIIALYTSATERVRITSAGDLGVGTAAPTNFGVGYQTIQVNATNGGVFRSSNTAGTAVGDFYADTTGVVILRSATNIPLTLQTNSVERFRIGTAGQLGIGGANYGTSGQVLTSGGPSAAPSWTTVASSGGTVTSVAVSGGTTGLTTSGGPITTTGTITLAGTLALTNGGTGATTDSAARTNLGLVIGTNVQAYDAGLQSIAGLTTAADTMIYTTALSTYATASLTAAGRAILDDVDAAAQRTTLGLGTIATQGAGAVAITGGTINGTTIGATTASTGAFTTGTFNLGAVGTPSITFAGDTNTGIFSPAADTIAFVEGGVEAMRIDASGFVGVGVTPSAWGSFKGLDIGASGSIASLITTTSVGSNWFFNGTNYVRKAIGYAPLYFLDAATGNHDFYTPGTGAAASTFAPGTVALSVRPSGVVVVPLTLQVSTITNSGATRGPNFSKAYVETVFALTGTTPALDPANGGIQTWTLTANSTPTDSVQAGESITLLIDDGTAFTVTWPSVTWKTNGGVAPTLLTTGLTVIVLWKVGSVLYGARVGDA